MAILLGDTGKGQVGTLKTFVISPSVPKETLLGTPLTLPTAEPTTSQIILTVEESNLPQISPSVPMKYNASIYCSGKIGTLASVINYRVLKNGVSVAQASGASATATQVWSHTHWRTFDVVVGDVLEVKYWAVQPDVNLEFHALVIYPSQPEVCKRGAMLKDLAFNAMTTLPSVTGTTVSNSQSWYVYPFALTNSYTAIGIANTTFPLLVLHPTYALFRSSQGETNPSLTTQYINATTRNIQKQYYPSQISFREILR